MYESFFGFQRRPFSAVPDVDSFYPTTELTAARDTLTRVVQRGEGPGVVVGPAGIGKSLLCGLMEQQFRHDFRVVTLACGQLRSLTDILQTILHELRQPYRSMNDGELRLALLDYLEPSDECPHGLLLLVDEAQQLSVEMLEEVRLISNFVRNGSPRVRLLLFGNAKLEEMLTDPKLESLNQRIARPCYLQGLSRDECRQYLLGLTAGAGVPHGVWDEDGLRAVQDATDGVPRLINQLADQALLHAARRQQRQIDMRLVEEAWAELQQLPTPWMDEADAGEPGVIEFGSLDDNQPPDLAEPADEPSPTCSDEPLETFVETGESSATPDNSWSELVGDSLASEDAALSPSQSVVQYELAADALDQIQQIELRLEEVERQTGDIEPPPQQPAGPQPRESAADPFGEFAEEEIVLDQRIVLGDSHRTVGPRVSSFESRMLVEALNDDPPSPVPAASEVEAPQPQLAAAPSATPSPSGEPQLEQPEQPDLAPSQFTDPSDSSEESYEPATVVPIFAASRDDRDIIVIEEDALRTEPSRSVLEQLRGV